MASCILSRLELTCSKVADFGATVAGLSQHINFSAIKIKIGIYNCCSNVRA
jgi:hypothetical protein